MTVVTAAAAALWTSTIDKYPSPVVRCYTVVRLAFDTWRWKLAHQLLRSWETSTLILFSLCPFACFQARNLQEKGGHAKKNPSTMWRLRKKQRVSAHGATSSCQIGITLGCNSFNALCTCHPLQPSIICKVRGACMPVTAPCGSSMSKTKCRSELTKATSRTEIFDWRRRPELLQSKLQCQYVIDIRSSTTRRWLAGSRV